MCIPACLPCGKGTLWKIRRDFTVKDLALAARPFTVKNHYGKWPYCIKTEICLYATFDFFMYCIHRNKIIRNGDIFQNKNISTNPMHFSIKAWQPVVITFRVTSMGLLQGTHGLILKSTSYIIVLVLSEHVKFKHRLSSIAVCISLLVRTSLTARRQVIVHDQ